MTPSEALQRLKEGNARFIARGSKPDWFSDLSLGQKPFATILGCSDSRVPPEIVFAQGLGDLFIVRVAGNVVGNEVLGSLGYALHHLRTPLFVVLGHERCGAVQAALQLKFCGVKERQKIAEVLEEIQPALERMDPSAPADLQWRLAVEANVRWSVRQLAETPPGAEALRESRIQLVGAVYELATGRVQFLEGGE